MIKTFSLLSLAFLLSGLLSAPAQDTTKKTKAKPDKTAATAASFCFFNAIPKPTPSRLFLNGQALPGKGMNEGGDSGPFRLPVGKCKIEIQNSDLPPLKVPFTVKKNESALYLVLLEQILDVEQKVTAEKIKLHSVPVKKGGGDAYRLSLLSACARPITVKVNKDTHELTPLQLKETEGWTEGALKASIVGPKEGSASPDKAGIKPESFAPDMAAHYILIFYDKADGGTSVRMLMGF